MAATHAGPAGAAADLDAAPSRQGRAPGEGGAGGAGGAWLWVRLLQDAHCLVAGT